MKFKRNMIMLFIYFILMFSYMAVISNEILSVDLFYTNIILFAIIFLILAINFDKDITIELMLHKKNKKKNYVILVIKNFTIKNFFSTTMIGFINFLILFLLRTNISFSKIVYYSINLFAIFEILFFIILAGRFVNKEAKYKLVCFISAMGFYLLASMDISFGISFNLFKFIFHQGNFFEILVHYLLWGYGSYLLFDYNCKKIEI